MIIKNGIVYDPANEIEGEKKDIFIKDGKIVEETKDSKIIDASNMLVFPGGIDLHTHIAGGKINAGRILRPEDGRKGSEPKKGIKRACSGYSVPNTFATGYRYAKMGYTFAIEPAMPPLLARHTHEELLDIPIIDKGAIPLLDNNWLTMEYVRAKEMEKLKNFISWMISSTKGYGVKLVNPGGVEAWGFGKNVRDIDERVPSFDVTPREIIRALAEVNEELKLPHSIHIHCNNLGHPGNYLTTIETFKVVEDLRNNSRQTMHATHIQFHSYGGTTWRDLHSKADEIAEYVNSHDNLTIDLGQVMFGDTTTMTADGPMEYELHLLSRRKWTNNDVELETGAGIIPILYSPKIAVNCIQWAIGLELALLIKDPWKVALSTDHPNGAPFTCYPDIISLLRSNKAREMEMKERGIMNVLDKRAILCSIDRELGWDEIAILTRAGPARILGLSKKGHLGVGADADIAIYDLSPEEEDPEKIKRAFSSAKYTIKNGEIVVKDGEVVGSPQGKTFYLGIASEVTEEVREKFELYYSVNLANYPVQNAYVGIPEEIIPGK